VPAPVPPDDAAAWYAPDVRAQREVHPGVVVTVRDDPNGEFVYDVREPALSAGDRAALDRIRDRFADAHPSRPRTREGTEERAAAGLEGKHRRVIDRLVDRSPAARRRVDYYALRDLRLLGAVTPLALDPAVEVADASGAGLVVHTEDFAPARTDLPADHDFLGRVLSERVERHEVSFREFRVPVVVYRERLLGGDAFDTKYAVLEPSLLPGDRELIEACKDRIWEANVDGVVGGADGDGPSWRSHDEVVEDRTTFVAERARTFLARQLTARNARTWLEATRRRIRATLAERGFAVPPVGERYATDRLDDLVYYVLRDFVGHDKLTVPIRDPYLEDIEVNRVGERVKVVPRRAVHGERVPTNLTFEDEDRLVNLVTQLAAADGVELNASNPSAKVNLAPAEVPGHITIRCAVALPVISEDGPHVSVRKQSPEAMTPADLVQRDSAPPWLVTLLWMLYEHHCVVLFAGPTGVGKTTLMNAHMPFIPYHDRPISIDEGSREVRLPQETGVSLTTRDHENEHKRVTMADLMTECNYLNPDVEVIAEINTPASFETFAEVLNTGHGVVGTTHAESPEALVNRAIEQGLPAYLLREVDLVVFPRHVDGERYVGDVVEMVGDDPDADESVEKNGSVVGWNRVGGRTPDGGFTFAYDHPAIGDDREHAPVRVFERVAERTDRPVEEVEAEFHRKYGYVEYMLREGMTGFESLFGFLSDLRNDEAATVERLQRRADGESEVKEDEEP
jgi:type IV secretory pathway ATPase VirB11/archaellum biosynthesis ATPase